MEYLEIKDLEEIKEFLFNELLKIQNEKEEINEEKIINLYKLECRVELEITTARVKQHIKKMDEMKKKTLIIAKQVEEEFSKEIKEEKMRPNLRMGDYRSSRI